MVHQTLVEKAKQFVNGENSKEIKSNVNSSKGNRLLIEQKHGGHLGFYEGGFWKPNPVTWIDRTVLGLADSLIIYLQDIERTST